MSEQAYPTPEGPVETLDPATLDSRINSGEPTAILDVRAQSEYEDWRLEGDALEIVNIPYYHFIDGIDATILDRVPSGDPLIVVCAKGGASEYVAGLLSAEGQEAVNLEDGMNGWANVYKRRKITAHNGPGQIFQYERPSSGCLSYLVVSQGKAAVIDPLRAFTDRYRRDAASFDATLEYAIDTHVHADHLSGVRTLAESGTTGAISAGAVDRGISYAGDMMLLDDGDNVSLGQVTLEARYAPGHTTGMNAYLIDESVLLTGDSLFVDSVARPDLEGGAERAPTAARRLYRTLKHQIRSLPADTIIAGGHRHGAANPADDGTYTRRLGALVPEMDELQLTESEFVELILADMPPRPANHEEIIAANLGQQDVDDETAFELELGPNNCAASGQTVVGD